MITEILVWWASQMRSLIPGGAARAAGRQDALIIAVERLPREGAQGSAPSGAILLRRGGQETRLHDFEALERLPEALPRDLPAVLRLPQGYVLCRDVTLPLAAARDLPALLGFEMDRLTPFSAEEVYWGVSGVTPDRIQGRLTMRLALVLRAQVEALLAGLARRRLNPAFIEAEAGRIELAGLQPRPGRRRQIALIGLCAALALACVITPFVRQELALEAAARAVDAASPAAHRALVLRQQLATAASGSMAIAEAKRAGDALQILAMLTAALPDGTWLGDLTLKSGTLTMDGQSSDAARLISLLSAVPGLRNPSFTAPVTRTADGRADQFSLNLTAAP